MNTPPVVVDTEQVKKSIQALSKDLSERAKIGYNKAETLVRTELNHVFNRAALDSMQSAGLDHYRFVATFDHRTCPRCGGVDGMVFEVAESMPGENYPPMHPRCRCTVVPSLGEVVGKRTSKVGGKRVKVPADMTYTEWRKIYIEKSKTLEQWEDERKLSKIKGMSSLKQTSKNSTSVYPPYNKDNVISKEDYSKLRNLADSFDIVLSGVKKADVSADILSTTLHSLGAYKNFFPSVFDKRYKLTLALGDFPNDEDFAITRRHIVTLNANAYRNVEILQAEYQKMVAGGWFVKGTDWRAIIHHEFGHIVSNVYKLDPMKIACEVTGLDELETLIYVKNVLSDYAFSLEDGTEIISEVFSDISSGNPCEFSRKYYQKVLEEVKEGSK